MCGRFLVLSDEDNTEILEIMKSIDKKYSGTKNFRQGEVFPGTDIPVLTWSPKRYGSPTSVPQPCSSSNPASSGQYDSDLIRWGIPLAGKSPSSQVINARSETLTEKPMFRTLVDAHRCLIPANGFFEWGLPQGTTHPTTGKKTKFLIKPSGVFGSKGINFFYMAGLISNVKVTSDMYTDCVVIITTRASSQMSKIHNRMPVIFDRAMADLWMTDIGIKKVFDAGIMEPWGGSLDVDAVA